MQKIMLVFALLSSAAFAYPAKDEEIPGLGDTAEPDAFDIGQFEELVLQVKTAPEFAGTKTGLRFGTRIEVIDRTSELAAKRPTPNSDPALDRILAFTSRASAARADIHIRYIRESIDSNGKPVKETLEIDAGVASGAAAEAQNALDEAMQKNHK